MTMKKTSFASLILSLILAPAFAAGAAPAGFTDDASALAALRAPAGSRQWPAATPLFAVDLSNATAPKPDAWSVTAGGLLTGRGILWTKTACDNFYLSLEFRAAEKADGGIFFRCSDPRNHVQNSIEVQLLQGDHPSGGNRIIAGALLDLAAPSRQIEIEPGKWHSLLLVAEGANITVYIDNERLVHADLGKWTTAGKNPDGTPNKFKRPLADFARSGLIGLHAADGKIEYRNLFLDPLSPAPAGTAAAGTTAAGTGTAAARRGMPVPRGQADGVPPTATADALVAHVTSTPWTASLSGGRSSTFKFNPDLTYDETLQGRQKRGAWRPVAPDTILATTPENTTITFIADLARNLLHRRGTDSYTPVNPAALAAPAALRGAPASRGQTDGVPPSAAATTTTAAAAAITATTTTAAATAATTTAAAAAAVTITADAAAALFADVTYLPPSTPAADTQDWTTQVPVITVPAATGIPSDATVLFDGSGLGAWESTNAKETTPLWKIAGGVLTPVDKTGSLRTKTAHGDVQIHLEFRSQTAPTKGGQARGNSGLLFMGRYEFQMLDSYENPTYANGQAAAIYKQHPPLVNASRPPGEWQTFDIIFIAPRFAADGALLSPARITAFHNGALVQHDAVLTGPTANRGRLAYTAHPARLPIVLQNHPVDHPSFRNIWLRDL
jgi:hypothetical protein